MNWMTSGKRRMGGGKKRKQSELRMTAVSERQLYPYPTTLLTARPAHPPPAPSQPDRTHRHILGAAADPGHLRP